MGKPLKMMKSVNPAAPEALNDRAGFYNLLRASSPIAKVDNPEYYILSGFEDVKNLLNDHVQFSKAWSNQYVRGEYNYALNQDPPGFDAFRAIYTGYMSPRGVRRWSADCERIANDLTAKLLPLGSGDVQQLFGKPLPALVTAIVLGLPEGELARYREWTDMFIDTMIRDPGAQLRVTEEMYAFFDEEFERRRLALRDAGIDEPSREHVGTLIDDNLISVLMTTKYQGRYLDNDELRRTVRGFFIGGVDTTGALILNVLYRLLEQPVLWTKLQENLDLVPAAIEESLRFDPPAIGMFRGTTCPVTIGGETIPQDARVMYSLFGANRDPAIFEDPNTFRLDRKPAGGTNMSFGGGAHFCPGAWTARAEAKVALEVLLRRLPRLRLTAPVKYFKATNFWVISSFPAAWD
jgi:cytochrome P450